MVAFRIVEHCWEPLVGIWKTLKLLFHDPGFCLTGLPLFISPRWVHLFNSGIAPCYLGPGGLPTQQYGSIEAIYVFSRRPEKRVVGITMEVGPTNSVRL